MTPANFSVLLTHFGDPFWALNAIESLKLKNPEFIIYVLDNSGNFPESSLYTRILTCNEVVGIASFQHGSALNWALKEIDFSTEYILVIDSDTTTFENSEWLRNLYRSLLRNDAIVALREGSRFLSHACFMVFPSRIARRLDFLQGQRDFGFDTGVLVGLQLVQAGLSVQKLPAKKLTRAPIGYVYTDLGILHVTSSSLGFMPSRYKPGHWLWEWKSETRKLIARRMFSNRKSNGLIYGFLLLISLIRINHIRKKYEINDRA